MNVKSATSTPEEKRFNRRLSRTVSIGLVILALFPALFIAALSYYRTRTLLSDQAISQLQSIVQNQSRQLQGVIDSNNSFLTSLVNDRFLVSSMQNVATTPNSVIYQYQGFTDLSTRVQSAAAINNLGADLIFLVSPEGKILAGSKQELAGVDVSSLDYIAALQGKKASVGVVNPEQFYQTSFQNFWIIFTSVPILDENNNPLATLVVATNTPLTADILDLASTYFPAAKAFYLSTKNNQLIGLDPTYSTTKELYRLPASDEHLGRIRSAVDSNAGFTSYSTAETGAVYSFSRLVPDMQLALVLEVPETVVFEPLNSMVPFTVLVFAISLVVGLAITYLGTRSIVRPLTQLAGNARGFAQGDWSQRAKVNRRDEIGLLAYSFNVMVEQISDLYRSMELKVEERTRQLRTASEVGQLATSASNREEIIQRAVRLIVERFGFTFASVFTLDDSGATLVLQEYNSQNGESNAKRGYRLPVSTESLIGWVAKNNQAHVIARTAENSLTQAEILLPESLSEIALPIAVGNQVLGILEVQSKDETGFEAETVSVLQTLCNQIANGMQNIRLLEATQINLEETTLLYRTSRSLSLTKNSTDLFQTLISTLSQTPYISGVFNVHEDHLSIMAITDPRSPSAIVATQGVTLPLQKVETRLVQNNMVLIENLSLPSEFDHILSFFSRRGCRSAAIFPVNEGQKLTKIIVLGSRQSTPLTLTALQPFSNLVEVINTTLERFSVLDDLQRRVNELQTYANLSEVISGETDLGALYQVLHQQIVQMIGGDLSFAVALYDSRKNTIQIPYLFENFEIKAIEPFPLGEGLTSIVVRSRKPLMLIKDTEAQAQALGAKILGKPARSWMGIPLIIGGEVVGVLILQDTLHEERFTQDDLNLFNTLAPQIGYAIRNAQLLTQMAEALQAYDQERFLLNSLMKNIPDQVTFKDQEGKFIRVSRSFANEFGVENPLDLIGKTIGNFIEESQSQKVQSEEQEIFTSGSPIYERIDKEQIGDKERWLQISKLPLEDDSGKITSLLGISRDITELKKADEISQQRAEQLQIAAEIARDTSGSLEMEDTLVKSVNLIRDRFGFYHASIFLIDSLGNYAILRESTGEVGVRMKASGHRLAVGSQSIVGQSTARRETLVINDVRLEANYYPNPLLPETRSEISVPLIVGAQLLGVIDVQSRVANAFTQEAIRVLEILADQLAVAVVNATLFARTQENLGQHRLLHQITVATASADSEDEALAITVQALRTSRGGGRVAIFLANSQGELELKANAGYETFDISHVKIRPGEGIIGKAALSRQPVRVEDALNEPEYITLDPEIRSELAVPIVYSDRLIGVLNLESTEPAKYDETDQEIMGSLGNTLGAILANAQLVRTVRQQVDRQRLLFEATSKIRRTVDVQSILQTSSGEICRALGARRAHIEITAGRELEPAPIAPPNNGHKQREESVE